MSGFFLRALICPLEDTPPKIVVVFTLANWPSF
jgi:hypothetical protein